MMQPITVGLSSKVITFYVTLSSFLSFFFAKKKREERKGKKQTNMQTALPPTETPLTVPVDKRKKVMLRSFHPTLHQVKQHRGGSDTTYKLHICPDQLKALPLLRSWGDDVVSIVHILTCQRTMRRLIATEIDTEVIKYAPPCYEATMRVKPKRHSVAP